MLPPVISNINSEILTLYTSTSSPNGNDAEAASASATARAARGRYAEIGVRRSDGFLEQYLLQQTQHGEPQGDQEQQELLNSGSNGQASLQSVGAAADEDASTTPVEQIARRQLGQLHHVQSEGSLSSDGSGTSAGADGSSGSTTCTEDDSGCGEVASCSISLIERLIRSHPIWFLPGIQRAGAFHLLQGKEEGNFVVRQSSQSDTMALSVRLPAGKGPYIEHYLIQANKGKLSLETSENRFDNIPSLIAHYSQCCDELPVQLTLPRAMREAKNRQQLSSLALLGQEFWRYPMANPKPPESGNSSNTSSLSSFHAGVNRNNMINNNHNNINNFGHVDAPTSENIVLNLTPISTKEFAANASQTPSPLPTSTTPVSRQPRPTPPNTLNLTQLNEPMSEAQCARWDSRQLSPSDKLSQRLISPNLVHHQQLQQQQHRCDDEMGKPTCGARFTPSNPSGPTSNFQRNIAGFAATELLSFGGKPSPEPLHQQQQQLKSPPPPPPRWAKPTHTPNGHGQSFVCSSSTTTVITTNSTSTSSSLVFCEISAITHTATPGDSNTPSVLSPQSSSSIKSLGSSASSTSLRPGQQPQQLLSPTQGPGSASANGGSNNNSNKSSSRRRRERDARKNSQHYQESDILESYYRSSPADKISDYEDIWNSSDRSVNNGPSDCHSRDDERLIKSSDEVKCKTPCASAGPTSVNGQHSGERMLRGQCKSAAVTPAERHGYKELLSPELSSFKPQQAIPVNSHEPQQSTNGKASSNSSTHEGSCPSPDDALLLMPTRPDLLSRVCSTSSLNSSRCAGQLQLQLGLVGLQQHQLTRSESNSPMTPDSKHGSPFYAEPADALPRAVLLARRRPRLAPGGGGRAPGKFGRHSEPGSWLQLQLLPTTMLAGCASDSCPDEYSDEPANGCGAGEAGSGDRAPLISSSSADNVAKRPLVVQQTTRLSNSQHQHQPKNRHKLFSDTSWAVDSSWEFIGNDADDCEPDYDCDRDSNARNEGQKYPDEKKNKYNSSHRNFTAQSIILQRYPELLRTPETTESIYSDRTSSYDNVERRQEQKYRQQQLLSTSTAINTNSTVPTASTTTESRRDRDTDRLIFDPSESETILDTDDSDVESIKKRESFRERLDPLLSPPRLQVLKNNESAAGPGCAGSAIRTYAFQLAADKTTTFSQNIENFIQCTKESKEASPHIVMRNMRQFMSGMKNYLVKHGEREFEREVEKERLKLKANEFLNLDAILENVMMHLVVRPLREHVYRLFVEHYASDGSLQTLAESMQLAQQKHIQDLGVRPKIIAPTEAHLDRILSYIEKLQISDSPLEKLENLLAAISAIVNSVKHANSGRSVTLGADDLLPLLVWVLVRGKVVDAEIEAEYMWGLLHSSLLTGEGGYYLTTLSSAVHVLKTFKSSQGTMSTNNGCGSPDCSSVLRVLVPDELHGSLNTKILPLRPNMNTRDICRILAHKIRCTNPQDYGLFKLVQGEETLLGDQECPQELSHCLFAYKRIDAKIAWPKTTSSGCNGGPNNST